MAEPDRPLPQPDFNMLSDMFRAAADEIQKLPNLPAVAGADRIVAEIQQMRNEAQQTRNETREHFARLEERMTVSHQSLLTALRTFDLNNAARVQNTYLSSPSDELSPFVNPRTGGVIPTFPTTPAELGQMRERDVNATLEELGLGATPAGTSLAMKKKRLRVHIGLRPQVEKSA